MVVQLSARGEFRRMLPLPAVPPKLVAVAPGGVRFALLAQRRRWSKDTQRLVALGPEGWLVKDLGSLESMGAVTRLRPDRASPDYVFLVGERRDRQSAFRLNVADPSRDLELSFAGVTGVPEHRAVDVASSAEHILVLDRGGKVFILSNLQPVRYLGQFDTELRSPLALALVPAVGQEAPEGGPQAYACVLPSGRAAKCIHVWRFRVAADGKPVVVKVGTFPDPERFPAELQLSSPVAMAAAFPDRPERLYVLDRGGSQVRVFDVADIAAKLVQRLQPDIPAKPLLDALPFQGEGLDLAIGPGQVIHVADQSSEAIHTYARQGGK